MLNVHQEIFWSLQDFSGDAVRLDRTLGDGASAWCQLQAAYDLAQVMRRPDQIEVGRVTWREARHAAMPVNWFTGMLVCQHYGFLSMFSARPIQETGLDARIAPGCGVPRILSGYPLSRSVLSRWIRLDIVLAVNSKALHDLKSMLGVGVRVRDRCFKEHRRHLGRCIHGLDRPITLETGDRHLGFNRLYHRATSNGKSWQRV